jgi:hypothetical protein
LQAIALLAADGEITQINTPEGERVAQVLKQARESAKEAMEMVSCAIALHYFGSQCYVAFDSNVPSSIARDLR